MSERCRPLPRTETRTTTAPCPPRRRRECRIALSARSPAPARVPAARAEALAQGRRRGTAWRPVLARVKISISQPSGVLLTPGVAVSIIPRVEVRTGAVWRPTCVARWPFGARQQRLERRQPRVQPEEPARSIAASADRPGFAMASAAGGVVMTLAERHDHVQAVDSATLEVDQTAAPARVRGRHGAREERWSKPRLTRASPPFFRKMRREIMAAYLLWNQGSRA